MEAMQQLIQWVKESQRLVFFGGAGVSTESGLPDFRSKEGLYASSLDVPPETILSHDYFMTHTDQFYTFYRSRMLFPSAKPNPAHHALARLEQMGHLKSVVTQNIDGLHELAGSRRVHALHGSVHANHCMSCHRFFDLDYILQSPQVTPLCDACGGLIKPDVVLYGEGLEETVIQTAIEDIEASDCLIVAGTSLQVYPAASLIRYHHNKRTVLVNLTKTPMDHLADLKLAGAIGEIMDQVIRQVDG